MDLAYRLLDVFTVAGDRLSGNPLCVFQDGRGLETGRMQALARQFSLSETTFVLPPERTEATARVRIFTPDFEMPFAGHPTLGTAHVVRALTGAGDRVGLEMKAGLVEVGFFFMAGGGVQEDRATGSAFANPGGYLLATGAPLPARRVVAQGAKVGRPPRLWLEVDEARNVFVTGQVVDLGGGTIRV